LREKGTYHTNGGPPRGIKKERTCGWEGGERKNLIFFFSRRDLYRRCVMFLRKRTRVKRANTQEPRKEKGTDKREKWGKKRGVTFSGRRGETD